MRLKVKTKGKDHLAEWEAAMRSAPELVEQMSEAAAEEALDLVAEGFQKQQDPYGTPWAPKKVDDGRPILVGETTRLRRGWHKRKTGKGKWTIAPSVEYAAAHQDPQPRPKWGGKKLPQRMMIPSKARGIPAEWQRRIQEALSEALSFHFGGGAPKNLGFLAYKIIGLKRRFSLQAIVKRAIREATDE